MKTVHLKHQHVIHQTLLLDPSDGIEPYYGWSYYLDCSFSLDLHNKSKLPFMELMVIGKHKTSERSLIWTIKFLAQRPIIWNMEIFLRLLHNRFYASYGYDIRWFFSMMLMVLSIFLSIRNRLFYLETYGCDAPNIRAYRNDVQLASLGEMGFYLSGSTQRHWTHFHNDM